jgi:hypothetical protein
MFQVIFRSVIVADGVCYLTRVLGEGVAENWQQADNGTVSAEPCCLAITVSRWLVNSLHFTSRQQQLLSGL